MRTYYPTIEVIDYKYKLMFSFLDECLKLVCFNGSQREQMAHLWAKDILQGDLDFIPNEVNEFLELQCATSSGVNVRWKYYKRFAINKMKIPDLPLLRDFKMPMLRVYKLILEYKKTQQVIFRTEKKPQNTPLVKYFTIIREKKKRIAAKPKKQRKKKNETQESSIEGSQEG